MSNDENPKAFRANVQALGGEQHPVGGPSPSAASWIGGHGTDPKEQKTQQSPAFGRSST